MRTVCLVTNYNYASYLEECLHSLALQTSKFDMILIVDDGSTDASAKIIRDFCERCSYAQAIFKENGGQLSCFHAGLEFIRPDDAVFFLDSDDLYPHDYLEHASRFLADETADFYFVKPAYFKNGEQPPRSACNGPDKKYLFPSTSALTRRMHSWIGAQTSCLCIRGALLHIVLPYPFVTDWRVRADDVLIFGSSIMGARKLYIESLAVGYRSHASNNFAGRKVLAEERSCWRVRHERLFKWYSEKAGVYRQPPLKNTLHESAIIPRHIRRQLGISSPTIICMFDILILVPIFKIMVKDIVRLKQL